MEKLKTCRPGNSKSQETGLKEIVVPVLSISHFDFRHFLGAADVVHDAPPRVRSNSRPSTLALMSRSGV